MKRKKKLTQPKKEPGRCDSLLRMKVVKWDPLPRRKVVMLNRKVKKMIHIINSNAPHLDIGAIGNTVV